ncbi:MAG: hypothetical protein RB191_12560 [Terriglobia bacterium]|nr:hypothetical protein [Terriglobia bacterium]
MLLRKPLQSQPSTRLAFAVALAVLLGGAIPARAQWQLQASGTRATLRGIHAVNAGIAWASGTNGTVLRTLDGGQTWDLCSIPPGAGKLDFRSVWAWDDEHAMAMSSGPGNESRLYSTHDGCRTWRLIFTNPDAGGFWDALQFDGTRFGVILGDPVQGSFSLLVTHDGGNHWTRQLNPCLRTMEPKQGAFAASNQALAVLPVRDAHSQSGAAVNHQIWFGTSSGWLYGFELAPLEWIDATLADGAVNGCTHSQLLPQPAGSSSSAAGIFAVAFHDGVYGVAVGGDYAKPQTGADTAAYTTDSVLWHPALGHPAGYRSTVAWNTTDGTWIAAGPNGSDVSRDGGKTWQPLDHGNWNSLSLPFAVGPDGRIVRLISWGQLRALNQAPATALHAQHKE